MRGDGSRGAGRGDPHGQRVSAGDGGDPRREIALQQAGQQHVAEGDARGWQPIAPSAIAFGGGLPRVPRAMTLEDIARVQGDFVAAARRALAAGFEWLELHFAHGYLAQSFFSAHSNQRDDAYGGSFDNRSRFLLETLAAVTAYYAARNGYQLDITQVSAARSKRVGQHHLMMAQNPVYIMTAVRQDAGEA